MVSEFNSGVGTNITSVRKLNPTTNEYEEYDFPLEYHLRIIYDFCQGDLGIESDIELALAKIINVSWLNPFDGAGDKNIQWKRWKEETKLGFLVYYAQTKIKLFQGKDIQGLELSFLSGYTNQHICKLLKDGDLEGEKPARSWVIPNKEARKFLSERKPGHYPCL